MSGWSHLPNAAHIDRIIFGKSHDTNRERN